MGALVTLDLPEDSPVLAMPWIITFGPADDSDAWEPVVCGPYERAHALSIAETVVADEDLLAVVEPVNPFASVDQIRAEIDLAKASAEEVSPDEYAFDDGDHDHGDEDEGDIVGSLDEFADDEEELPEVEPTPPPSPDEVRAGFARIASRLSAGLPAGV